MKLRALYDALDAERQSRQLTWADVRAEINGQFAGPSVHPISTSTITGWETAAVAEGDGVLQALRWLNRSPESFSGKDDVRARATALPAVPADCLLRFDAIATHAAIDAERQQRSLTWRQAADEIGGVSAAGLTRLSNGGRVSFPTITRIAEWLRRPVMSLTKLSRS